jgi:hypothetical protein
VGGMESDQFTDLATQNSFTEKRQLGISGVFPEEGYPSPRGSYPHRNETSNRATRQLPVNYPVECVPLATRPGVSDAGL